MWTTTTCGSCGSGWEPSLEDDRNTRLGYSPQGHRRPERRALPLSDPEHRRCPERVGRRRGERPSEQDLLARLRRDPSIAAADRLDSSEECDVLQRPGVAQRTKGLEPLAPPLIHEIAFSLGVRRTDVLVHFRSLRGLRLARVWKEGVGPLRGAAGMDRVRGSLVGQGSLWFVQDVASYPCVGASKVLGWFLARRVGTSSSGATGNSKGSRV